MWVFILLLPFQLVGALRWSSIPAWYVFPLPFPSSHLPHIPFTSSSPFPDFTTPSHHLTQKTNPPPASLASAYMLLGLSSLSYEIENPFGTDLNDLPLDIMCDVLTTDVDVITAHRMSTPQGGDEGDSAWLESPQNRPLLPVVRAGWGACVEGLGVGEIREALRLRVERVTGEGAVCEDEGQGVEGVEGVEKNKPGRIRGEKEVGGGRGFFSRKINGEEVDQDNMMAEVV